MKKILISAGHGGSDPGACGNNYVEAVLATKLRDSIYNRLEQAKVPVIRDGLDGTNETLKKSILLAKIVDIAVEIHFNASENPAATGIEALAHPNNKTLSQELCKAISSVTGISLRGGLHGWKDPSSGQHHRLGFCEAGGIILEVCFISNTSDMQAYINNKTLVATELAKVLTSYAKE